MDDGVFSGMASSEPYPLDEEYDGHGEWISHEIVQSPYSRRDSTSQPFFHASNTRH